MAGQARQRRRPARLGRRARLREPGPYRAGTGAAEGYSVSARAATCSGATASRPPTSGYGFRIHRAHLRPLAIRSAPYAIRPPRPRSLEACISRAAAAWLGGPGSRPDAVRERLGRYERRFGLGLGPHWPGEYDVRRLWAGGHRDLAADQLCPRPGP